MTNKRRTRERRISIRSIRKDPPDYTKLGQALIALAVAQAEAEAEAEAKKSGEAVSATEESE
jgi:hypothetical protein